MCSSYLIVDLETSGLDPAVNEILEVCFLKCKVRNFEITAEYSARIKPTRIYTASPRALEINGYTEEKWSDAVPVLDALRALRGMWEEDLIWIGSNPRFDWHFLYEAYREARLPPVTPRKMIGTEAIAWGRGIRERNGLAALCSRFGITNEAAHTAKSDVHATLEVLKKLLEPNL